jgi:hypothetical protein
MLQSLTNDKNTVRLIDSMSSLLRRFNFHFISSFQPTCKRSIQSLSELLMAMSEEVSWCIFRL